MLDFIFDRQWILLLAAAAMAVFGRGIVGFIGDLRPVAHALYQLVHPKHQLVVMSRCLRDPAVKDRGMALWYWKESCSWLRISRSRGKRWAARVLVLPFLWTYWQAASELTLAQQHLINDNRSIKFDLG